jgi:predicted metal-dependent hydrolase
MECVQHREGTPATQTMLVRRPRIDFDKAAMPYYLRGNAFISHLTSSFNLLLPDGEEFVVRSVRNLKSKIKDPNLRLEIDQFSGQEFQHKYQAENFIKFFEKEHYKINKILRYVKPLFQKGLRSLPYGFQVAYAAGSEHITASFAHAGLKFNMLDNADPRMCQFLLWHAIEEIEHKRVAFDVFKTVHPRNYLLRSLSYLAIISVFFGYSFFATGTFIRQDLQRHRLNFKQLKEHWLNFIRDKEVRGFAKSFFISLCKYFKPGFHPNQIDDKPLLDLYYPELQKFS